MSARRRLAAIAALTLVAGVAAIALVAHRLLDEWLAMDRGDHARVRGGPRRRHVEARARATPEMTGA